VFCVPLTPSAPFHPPEALQEVALVEVHVSVAESPASTVIDNAVSVTLGSGLVTVAPPPQAASSSAATEFNSQEG
jgi:hypothetical protein